MTMVTPRPLRADAERNRRRILDAAREVFARDGLDAGVDGIARAAGVGVGTVYRRFPTKDELLVAVIDDTTSALVAELERAGTEADPWDAFAAAAYAMAATTARNRTLHQVFQESWIHVPSTRACRERTLEALGAILDRAQEAHVVRDDLVVADVAALCAVAARLPAWRLDVEPDIWMRYLGVVLDGMRPEAATALPHPPPVEVSASPAVPSGAPAIASPRARAPRP